MKVYISGQISGRTAAANEGAFYEAALKLESLGFEPVSPYRGDEGMTWQDYMRRDIKLLMECDAIFMLSGWAISKGANIERELAKSLGFSVMYEDLMDMGFYDDHV